MSPDALADAVRVVTLPGEPDGAAEGLARRIAERAAGLRAVIFFGSRKSGAGANSASAYDLFLAVDDYASFYRSLARAGWVRRRRSATWLNRVLPPNVISLAIPTDEGSSTLAKCAVITLARLERETSSRRRDHFCIGRLFQPVEVLWADGADSRERCVALLASAVRETAAWGRPWLSEPFDVETFLRTLLRVSLAGEIRPEPTGRAERLFEAQRESALPVFRALLRELEERGVLVAEGRGEWRWTRPPGSWETLRVRAYFWRSKLRATLRWAKYMVTFEGWLDYLLRKVTRHTGQEIILSERERRYPLVFLWPRFFRYLREKDGGSTK